MSNARSGIIFDVREFTVHDGPGIRTTVFLKGCPLRCAWCHNPEGLLPKPQMLRGAGGNRLVGKEYRSTELAELLNRQANLLRGKGGVTFSGGEPLAQAAFVAEVIEQLDRLHVVLDTSGYASKEDFRLVAAKSDLVYFDLKLIDFSAHEHWTGVENQTIIRNLRLLSAINKPFVVRVPLVPGVTDTKANLSAIAATVQNLPGLQRVELLAYNRAAGGKYAACGLSWKPDFDENQIPNPQCEFFSDLNIEVSTP
jgi:pyruvate formate lyase activating enzyme